MQYLDNPVWWSLHHEHASVAERAGEVARYPVSYTPFIAVETSDADTEGARELVAVDEVVYFLGEIPRLDPKYWTTVQEFEVQQFAGTECDVPVRGHSNIRELTESDKPAMLALAREVYPFFFRADTASLGRYLGYWQDGALVAMGGERMRVPGYQELSTLCIRPQFARSGISFSLFHHLVVSTLRGGRGVFMHCVRGNDPVLRFAERALKKLGGTLRAELPMIKVIRTA